MSHYIPFSTKHFFLCFFDDKWTRGESIRRLYMNGRSLNRLLVITMQYPLGIPPVLRTNVDYVFILRENIMSNQKHIYETYVTFTTFAAFCTILNGFTEDYECLVIDNNSKSDQLEDRIFWYRAELHNDFRIGSKELWE